MQRPQPSEHAPYYSRYIDLVDDGDILAALESQRVEMQAMFSTTSDEVGPVTHPPYTWSVNQLLDHIIDGERVFAYRALRFARGDTTHLPGFDENAYAKSAGSDRNRLRDVAADFDAVRNATIMMFRRFPPEAWMRGGIASDNPVTVLALAWIIVGHAQHHMNILRKRLSSG